MADQDKPVNGTLEQNKPTLKQRAKDVGTILGLPGKVLAAVSLIISLFSYFLGWVAIHNIILTMVGILAVGIGLIFLAGKMRPANIWLRWLIGIAFLSIELVIFLAIPSPIAWQQIALPFSGSPKAPHDLIESELNGRSYPGGEVFKEKVKVEREKNKYLDVNDQFIPFGSSHVTPNRTPHTIKLKNTAKPGAITAYVFVNDNTFPLSDKLKIPGSWRKVSEVGFNNPVSEISIQIPEADSKKEIKIVALIFPFSETVSKAFRLGLEQVADVSFE